MEQQRWLRMQALFEQAVVLAPDRRRAFIEAETDDESLRRDVLRLLAADEQHTGNAFESLLQRAAAHRVGPLPAAGQRVGPWQLLQELGAGGMGTVFLAERADGAWQGQVAVKFLAGIPSREGARAMQRERQILAGLRHPNIARLIDGGLTEAGQPYLVMEHVEGVPITEFVEGKPLDLRLRLIQQLAGALHAAHRQLVVHRDLKPANVLVRADATPVLLDFGIARLLDDGEQAQPQTARAWFTPGYASPEQRRGEAVGTAADIYSLGQLMAEVLSGEHRAPGPQGEVVPPSQRGLRGLPKRRLRELDAIVQQACAVDPAQRYASAEALVRDIERYFQHQPLMAAPARPGYLIRTLLRRHRVPVAAAVLGALALAGFTVGLIHERNRARQAEALALEHAATTEGVVDYLVSLFEEASPERAANQALLPADLIDRGRERLQQRLADQPRLQARMYAVLARIDAELGRTEQALESLHAALALEQGEDGRARRLPLLMAIGDREVLAERPQQAVEAYEQALALIDAGMGDLRQRAEVQAGLAMAKLGQGEGEAGLAHAQAAVELAREVDGGRGRSTSAALQVLSEAYRMSAEPQRAIAPAIEALEIERRLLPEGDPAIGSALSFLANTHRTLGNNAQAEDLFGQILNLRLETLDPGSAWVISARNNLADAIHAQGRLLEALALMQENLDQLAARGEQETPTYLLTLNNVASLHEATGNYPRSIALFQELLQRMQQAGESGQPRFPVYRQNLGRSLLLAGRLDEAIEHIAPPVDSAPDPVGLAIGRARRLLHLGEWHCRRAELTQAQEQIDAAQELLRSVLDADHPRMGAVLRGRACIARQAGDIADEIALRRQALELWEASTGADSHLSVEARLELAETLLRADQADAARPLFAAADEHIDRLFVSGSPQVRMREHVRQALDPG